MHFVAPFQYKLNKHWWWQKKISHDKYGFFKKKAAVAKWIEIYFAYHQDYLNVCSLFTTFFCTDLNDKNMHTHRIETYLCILKQHLSHFETCYFESFNKKHLDKKCYKSKGDFFVCTRNISLIPFVQNLWHLWTSKI